MTLGIRKIVVLSLIGIIFLVGNILLIVNWLAEEGINEKANWLCEEFLTGTAITVIVALLIPLFNPKTTSGAIGLFRRCPVCDKMLVGNQNYCGECGSKVKL